MAYMVSIRQIYFRAKAVCWYYYGRMRIVQVKPKPVVTTKKRHFMRWVSLALIAIIAVGAFNYLRPLPVARISLDLPSLPGTSTPHIDWPATGDATFTAVGYDFVLSNSQPKPTSTASMAKVITVLCVLEKHPLQLGETGPIITMTADDVSRLQQQYDQGGSRLAIVEGEKLTQYQMLQAIMLPSANNIADSLAIWAFGSLEQYQRYAQDYVTRHSMPHTHIGPDASGFDPSTTSTTSDLTTLGKLALANPVIMQIAGTKSAEFETAGKINNTNKLLSGGVINGLKTGANEGNSGGFIFTAVTHDTHAIKLVGAIVNAGSSATAVAEAEKLASSVERNFHVVKYTKKGERVGTVKTAWGSTTTVVAVRNTEVVRWSTHKVWHVEQLSDTDGTKTGRVGTLAIRTNGSKSTTPLAIASPASGPSTLWRITHFR